MKLFFAALICSLFVGCGQDTVEVGKRTTMEVKSKFDAGKVKKGEIVKAKFKVTNTGKYPLVITEVTPSCSCTLASKPEEPIKPGDHGFIEVSVDTEAVGTGVLHKSVNIVANTTPSVTKVLIEGVIVK